jgi:hypothetical protein
VYVCVCVCVRVCVCVSVSAFAMEIRRNEWEAMHVTFNYAQIPF